MVFDPRDLETAACPLCNSRDRKATSAGRDGLGVVRCRSCGLLFLSPRLREDRMMAHYRDPSYFEGNECGYSSYAGQERSLRLTFRHLLGSLDRRGLTGGTLLEVGCGHGYFLDEARSYAERRVGTDLSEVAATVARGFADEVWCGGLEAVPAGERFDLVVALQVIEHVYDPRAFVGQLVARVKPRGHLLLATPDAGSIWYHALGSRWPSYKFPEHVAFYDRRTLTRLLTGAGLQGIQKVPHPHAFPVSEILGKMGIPAGEAFGRRIAWIPGTVLALAGQTGG